jgi:photosystem II stability/assembly factor-like uncharacterized protein
MRIAPMNIVQTKMTRAVSKAFLLGATCVVAGTAAPDTGISQQIDPELLAGMEARAIGPAGMSGRVADVVAAPSDPTIVYVGAATGGVWKSVSGGLSFEPIFDDQPVAAIGALAVHPSDPDVLWVGTGEGNVRNSVSVGNGVYRTRDGGETWEHLGLEGSERITRIVLDPANPEVAYVAAMGREWGENPERGVFRTRDGAKTWEKILYVDEKTGAADLVMHPDNPDVVFAAMWEYRRWPWFFKSGGPGSGLHVTRDGGESWTRLTPEDGLPEGDLGRIGLGISRSSPEIMYAFIEAKENGLYRSTDGGRSWKNTGAREDFGNRPFYYADLRVDPEYPNRVYSLWSRISVSDDAGKSWEQLVSFSDVHPDHHAMWINPSDARHIIIGNDGGVAISKDRGDTWRFVSNLPLAQYYHIRVDDELPYNVYGGMQDNRRIRHRLLPGRPDAGLRDEPGRQPLPLEPGHGRAQEPPAGAARGRGAALQLERRLRPGSVRRGNDLLRKPVRSPIDEPGGQLGGHQPRPHHRQPGVATTGRERRPHAGRHERGELHQHHRDRAQPGGAWRHLGRYR